MISNGESNLEVLLKTLKPEHNDGDFVFCVVDNLAIINPHEIVMLFKEREGHTVILEKDVADKLGLQYSFISAWITLTVHSSLAAVGLTASFSKALSDKGISCNVVAGFYHDHIFVDKRDVDDAMNALTELTR